MDKKELLRFCHVTVTYGGRPVLRNVSLSLKEGETLAVVGASGSGKSTLLKAITGMLGDGGFIPRGDIYFRGMNLVDLEQDRKRKLLGREIAVVRQDAGASFCPVRTLGSQIREYVEQHGGRGDQAFAESEKLMKRVGLTDTKRIWDSYPFELSGGMNQRMGIVAACLFHPHLLLADEPTSALDVLSQDLVLDEMKLLKEDRTALILVTHNMGVAAALSENIVVMEKGCIREMGKTADILAHPQHPYTKKLLDSMLEV